MDRESLAKWLEGFKAAWEACDPEAAVQLFTAEARYQPSPFQLSIHGSRGIRAFWRDTERLQRDVAFTATPMAVEGGCGVAHFHVTFRRLSDNHFVEQDGLMQVALDGDGRCRDLRLWAAARSRPAYTPPLR